MMRHQFPHFRSYAFNAFIALMVFARDFNLHNEFSGASWEHAISLFIASKHDSKKLRTVEEEII